jgi:hypothetical protein
MNCCDYNCTQGRECPARQSRELPITMNDEDQPVSIDDVFRWIRNVLAGVGFTAMLVFICFIYGFKS